MTLCCTFRVLMFTCTNCGALCKWVVEGGVEERGRVISELQVHLCTRAVDLEHVLDWRGCFVA